MVPPLNACGGSKPVKDRLAPKHHVNSVCGVIYISSNLSTSGEKVRSTSSNQVNESHGKMLLVGVSQMALVQDYRVCVVGLQDGVYLMSQGYRMDRTSKVESFRRPAES